ncbi:lysophospholipid acyltransferase family protein [Candidatus Electronema sp. PJ]|uniref:lysophospholipid acyltransferase family protein n=1 Tax=Candidatus Electronema sp. PJ TaxID=3401572 RepID=UPI003AA8C4DC
MSDLLYRISIAIAPRLYVVLSSLWFGTCRLEVRGQENMDKMLAHGAGVVPFWHYSVFYMIYHLRHYSGVAMVSASKDGEYLARVVRLLNFETVRGSSNRFGVRALKGMVDHVKQGKNAGIVADGSQGPPLKAQPGAILLAAKSGSPIVPVAWAVKYAKAFNSWDRTLLPLPFSPMILQYGEPIWVEPELTAETVEQYRQQLETVLNTMYRQLWGEFGREGHGKENEKPKRSG